MKKKIKVMIKLKKNTSKKISNQNELKIVFINLFLEYLERCVF